MTFTFKGRSSVSWRWWTFRGPSTSRTIENVEKLRKFIHKDHRWTIHELTDTTGISYGVYQEILPENLNVRHTAPSSRQCARPRH
jgi:hypothetical protein